MPQENVTVEGQIDASWTSYGVPPQNGETIAGTTKEDFGKIGTDAIPQEAREKNLTELETELIETAVVNADSSLQKVSEKVDVSYSTLRRTLIRCVPEWYEGTFKNRGPSKKYSPTNTITPDISTMSPVLKEPVSDEELINYIEDKGEAYVTQVLDDSEWGSHSQAWTRLTELEKEGKLASRKEGNKRFFFVPDEEDIDEVSPIDVEEDVDSDFPGSIQLQKGVERIEEDEEDISREEVVGEETQITVTDYEIGLIETLCEYEMEGNSESPFASFVLNLLQSDREDRVEQVHLICQYQMEIEESHLAKKILDVLQSFNN